MESSVAMENYKKKEGLFIEASLSMALNMEKAMKSGTMVLVLRAYFKQETNMVQDNTYGKMVASTLAH